MFGASWCPHCASQKQMFGRSLKNMPYFECSKNGTQVQECNDRAIMSYPTWQFSEKALAELPKEAMLNLLNTEVTRVRNTSQIYAKNFQAKKDILTIIENFDKKTDQLLKSDVSDFEKLKTLKVLSEDETGSLVEKPVYIAGRMAGERPLSEIALYAGCSAEYQADISAPKK